MSKSDTALTDEQLAEIKAKIRAEMEAEEAAKVADNDSLKKQIRTEIKADLEKDKQSKADQNRVIAERAMRAAKNDKVPYRLFKDNDKYKDDVTVSVNGVTYQIKRGVNVMIPRMVAEILENSQSQDTRTANLMEQTSADYESAARSGSL